MNALMSTTGVFLYATNNPPAGFQLTVPATDLPRRLKIYLGLYRAQGMLHARLSDSSAVPYSDASVLRPDSNTKAVYTLVFASANPGANLVVTWTPAVVFDPSFGNVTWQAATLWQQPPQPILQVVSPPPAPNGFAVSFYAQTGTNYTVQFVDDLNSTNWQTLTNLAGPGAFALVTDPAIGPARRFYRVVAQ